MLRKHFNFPEIHFRSVVTAAIILTSLVITDRPAKSAVLALSDDNSIAAFDPDFSNIPSNNGLLFWTVDDVNQLFQNQFWYRIGSEGRENSISTLNLIDLDQAQPADNQFSVTYAGIDFHIALNLRLDGGAQGSGISSLFENITIKNTGSNQLDFHFFNYTDFDLTENGEQDTTKIASSIATQLDNFTFATEVINPVANYYQVSPFPNILDALEDDVTTTLANFSEPLTGDNAYAFQWDLVLEPEQSFSINNYKSIAPVKSVPEPTMTLGFITFSGLMLIRDKLRKLRCIAKTRAGLVGK
ncbi:hypothetical protein [Nostoc sp. WHI]|uniref:hypothetical protein n=1 Tax=Nostoc sp. WHI TaxID=2650611 RepID=UPI0018C52E54|nr:hypothetical protein [Nostoc sp. WHI]MBG1269559.1 hypothetical protein [Nostoc sp. WHI]